MVSLADYEHIIEGESMLKRFILSGIIATQVVCYSSTYAADLSDTLVLGDLHKIGDVANMEGDKTAHQLQEEVNFAHTLINDLSLDELTSMLDELAPVYQSYVTKKFLTDLAPEQQQFLLNSVYSLEAIKEGLLLEHGYLQKSGEPRQVNFYCADAILDRPLIKKVNLGQITKESEEKGYSLKESLLEDYDEALVNQAFLALLSKNTNSVHGRFNIPENKTVRFTAQIHRGSSGMKQVKLLVDMLNVMYGPHVQINTLLDTGKECFYKLAFDNKVELIFRNGYLPYTLKGYLGSYFVNNLGLVMGLSPDILSGKVVIPTIFLPFNQVTLELFEYQKRTTKNHLKEIVDDVLADNDLQSKVLTVIKSNPKFQSQNKAKIFEGRFLNKGDFSFETRLFIITDIWNPKEGDEQKFVKRITSKL